MDDPRAVLAKQWNTIARITAFVGRKYRLRMDEVDDLLSIAAVKLYEGDCRIMREFRGGSLKSFLRVVIQRIFLDEYIHEKGKWHISAEAKRSGPAAVELERLIHRDGLTHDLAISRVTSSYPDVGRSELEAIVARLPARTRWSRVPLDDTVVESTPNRDETDLLVIDRERREISARAACVIREYLLTVPPSDRLMLQFQFESGMQLSQIARSLQTDQAALYRRRQKLFHELAALLRKAGITAEEIRDLIGHMDTEIDFGLKNNELSPSQLRESQVAGEGEPR